MTTEKAIITLEELAEEIGGTLQELAEEGSSTVSLNNCIGEVCVVENETPGNRSRAWASITAPTMEEAREQLAKLIEGNVLHFNVATVIRGEVSFLLNVQAEIIH